MTTTSQHKPLSHCELCRNSALSLEHHHVAGRANAPSTIIDACHACHQLLTHRQHLGGVKLSQNEDRTLVDRSWAAVHGVLDVLSLTQRATSERDLLHPVETLERSLAKFLDVGSHAFTGARRGETRHRAPMVDGDGRGIPFLVCMLKIAGSYARDLPFITGYARDWMHMVGSTAEGLVTNTQLITDAWENYPHVDEIGREITLMPDHLTELAQALVRSTINRNDSHAFRELERHLTVFAEDLARITVLVRNLAHARDTDDVHVALETFLVAQQVEVMA